MLKSLMETTDKLELVSAKGEKQRNKLWTEQLKLVLKQKSALINQKIGWEETKSIRRLLGENI